MCPHARAPAALSVVLLTAALVLSEAGAASPAASVLPLPPRRTLAAAVVPEGPKVDLAAIGAGGERPASPLHAPRCIDAWES
jgi:hypothetical protein